MPTNKDLKTHNTVISLEEKLAKEISKYSDGGYYTPDYDNLKAINDLINSQDKIHNSNINLKYIDGTKKTTLLNLAITKKLPTDIMRNLIEKITDTQILDGEGFSALSLSVQLLRYDLIENLISKGVERVINQPDIYGDIPILHAMKDYHGYSAEKLIPHVTNINFQHEKTGHTLLMDSIFLNGLIFNEIIDAKHNVNLQDHEGNTALHYIFGSKNYFNINMLNKILKSQVNVNVKNKDGITPLHMAALNGHTQGALELIKHGARWDIKSKHKYIPNIPKLFWRFENDGDRKPSEYLVINENTFNKTAYDLAQEKGLTDVITAISFLEKKQNIVVNSSLEGAVAHIFSDFAVTIGAKVDCYDKKTTPTPETRMEVDQQAEDSKDNNTEEKRLVFSLPAEIAPMIAKHLDAKDLITLLRAKSGALDAAQVEKEKVHRILTETAFPDDTSKKFDDLNSSHFPILEQFIRSRKNGTEFNPHKARKTWIDFVSNSAVSSPAL